MTIDFYNRNADDFFARTNSLNVEFIYQPFLALIPAGGHILDAGCGSGRDSKAFLARGYQVTAFDASVELVRLAAQNTGLPVQHMTFADMTYENAFDGVWTCATLLHVPHNQMESTYHKFTNALKPGAVWYISYKVGQGEQVKGERLFTYFDESTLRQFIARFPTLECLQIWENGDTRPALQHERWVNALVRKTQPDLCI